MLPVHLLSGVEQSVEHLRKGLGEERWRGRLPGVLRLAAECGVSKGVELLEWFHLQATPCIFLGSRTGNFQWAGAGLDLKSSMQAATRKLLELGHQQIVLVDPAGQRLPRLSESVLAFTCELDAHWDPLDPELQGSGLA